MAGRARVAIVGGEWVGVGGEGCDIVMSNNTLEDIELTNVWTSLLFEK